MTDDEILTIARECNFLVGEIDCLAPQLLAFARRIQAAQKELDAKICDALFADQVGAIHVASIRCAAAIRSQSDE